MDLAAAFNRSRFGAWIHSPAGRAFRLVAGVGFLSYGLPRSDTGAGKAALAWGVLPLSAGAIDLCWVSAALGGPLRGQACRTVSTNRR